MKATRTTGTMLFSLALAAVAFVLPAKVKADMQCKTDACTYDGTKPGHCGIFDTDCGCFENSPGHGGEWQVACENPPL